MSKDNGRELAIKLSQRVLAKLTLDARGRFIFLFALFNLMFCVLLVLLLQNRQLTEENQEMVNFVEFVKIYYPELPAQATAHTDSTLVQPFSTVTSPPTFTATSTPTPTYTSTPTAAPTSTLTPTSTHTHVPSPEPTRPLPELTRQATPTRSTSEGSAKRFNPASNLIWLWSADVSGLITALGRW